MSKPDPRCAALEVLDQVRRSDVLVTAAVRKTASKWGLRPGVIAATNNLVLETLRRRRLLDGIMSLLVDRGVPSKDGRLMDLVRLALCELLYVEKVPDYACVHRFVDLARRIKGPGVASFVNAILRKAASSSLSELESRAASAGLGVRHSMPDWLVEASKEAFADRFENELIALNLQAPIALRVNRVAAIPNEVRRELEEYGLHPEAPDWLPDALVLPSNEPPYETMPFIKGRFWPQDLASQLISTLSTPGPGSFVLDACAGWGTKGFSIAALAPEVQVISADISPSRLAVLAQRAESFRIKNVFPVIADLTAPPFPPGSFDSVLVDAPCSGLGTIRRHPELKWRRTPQDPVRNASLQLALLKSLAPLVKPGGRLVYTVCSFIPLEGPLVVDAFLQSCSAFKLELPSASAPSPLAARLLELENAAAHSPYMRPGMLFTLPSLMDCDCFFLALLRKKKAPQ